MFFTNLDSATAPAQEVVVADRLDPAKVDLSSLSLSLISFGDHVISPPPGLSDYSTDVDLRPAKDLVVRITGHLDSATGVLTWRFRSLDPATMQPPEDPLVGFLPPDTNPPNGEGSVLFTVMPKAGLATGTEVRNKATIVFDQNAPIDTQEWLNTLDNSKPSSAVSPLPETESSPTFDVHWSGTDDGAGIQDYSVFVSEDGGPFTAWQLDTPDTSAAFTGTPGKRYAFFSIARDRAFNLEDAPAQPDATTRVEGETVPPTTTIALAPASPNGHPPWYVSPVHVTVSAADNEGGSGVKETRCVLDPATAPAAFSDIPAGCPYLGPGGDLGADGQHTLYAASEDNAGNDEAPVSRAIAIDRTPPTITCQTPTPSFLLHQTGATVSATLSDLTSGPGALIPLSPQAASTLTVGLQSVSYSGTDVAGNVAPPVLCNYVVGYKFLGFFPPLPKGTVNTGATVPVKFALADVGDVRIPDAEAAGLVDPANCQIAVVLVKPAGPVAGCPRYDATDQQFVFTLKTTSAMAGANGISVTVTIGTTVVTTSPTQPVTIG